jgi:hypothetical protein
MSLIHKSLVWGCQFEPFGRARYQSTGSEKHPLDQPCAGHDMILVRRDNAYTQPRHHFIQGRVRVGKLSSQTSGISMSLNPILEV